MWNRYSGRVIMKHLKVSLFVMYLLVMSGTVYASNRISVQVGDYYVKDDTINITGIAGISEVVRLRINNSYGYLYYANTTTDTDGEYVFRIRINEEMRPDVYDFIVISQDNQVASKFKVSTMRQNGVAKYVISLAEQNKNKVVTAFFDVKNLGEELPPSIFDEYNEGLLKLEEAKSMYAEDRFSEAIESARKALKTFQILLRSLYSEFLVQPPSVDESARLIIHLDERIEKSRIRLERLEIALRKASSIGIIAPRLKETLEEIDDYLDLAGDELEDGNIESCKQALDTAHLKLISVERLINQNAERIKRVLIDKYRKYFTTRLNQMKETLSKLSTVMPDEKIAPALDSITLLQKRLLQIQIMIQNGQVDEALRDLQNTQKDFEKILNQLNSFSKSFTLLQIDKLTAKIQSLNNSITQQEYEGVNTSKTQAQLNEAQKAFEEAKRLLEEGDFNSALSVLSDNIRPRYSSKSISEVYPEKN
jgi:tetratricopeptide (TPR) repeat protein